MEFLAPFTHMPGPAFLILYAAIFAILFCISLLVRSQIDQSSSKEPLTPEADPEPYRIAYLRGGANEVLRLATFELFTQGAVGEQTDGLSKTKSSSKKWKLVPEKFDPTSVSPFALEASHFFSMSRKPTELFQSNIAVQLSDHFRRWDQWIEREELKISSDKRFKISGIAFGLASTFFAIGIAKIMIALSNERYNVGFAIAMMIAGSIAILCTALIRKLSSRGRAYLSAIQTVNSHHRSLAHMSLSSPKDPSESDATSNALGGMPIMAMALFGVAALQASPFDGFRRTYQRSQSSCSGCGAAASCAAFVGSSCGSGGSGDGGASCGGGGGGGGGCGGCGGGCGGS